MMSNYPEHDKLKLVHSESQAIGEFIQWLYDEGHEICNMNEYGEFFPWYKSINEILALYFDIDLNKLNKEKDPMIDKRIKCKLASLEYIEECIHKLFEFSVEFIDNFDGSEYQQGKKDGLRIALSFVIDPSWAEFNRDGGMARE